MTATEFRETIFRLGLSQRDVAWIFGVHPMTAWRWGKSGLSGPEAIVLRLLTAGKLTPSDVNAARVEEMRARRAAAIQPSGARPTA